MPFLCRELERALQYGEGTIPEPLRQHAEGCPSCSDMLKSWEKISETAQTMKRGWESPDLWPRISESLSEASRQRHPAAFDRFHPWKGLRVLNMFWRPAWAGFILLTLGFLGIWALLHPNRTEVDNRKWLLTEQALKDVETTEQAYIRSIEKLSGLVRPKEKYAASPFLANYREKLLVIDEAIADCRSHIELNRFNTHLRRELLTLYQEKQATLQELLKENHYVEN